LHEAAGTAAEAFNDVVVARRLISELREQAAGDPLSLDDDALTEPGTVAFAEVLAVQRPPVLVLVVATQVAFTGNGMSCTVAASFRLGPL